MPQSEYVLDGHSLTIESVVRVARDPGCRVSLEPHARRALLESRRVVDRAVESGSGQPTPESPAPQTPAGGYPVNGSAPAPVEEPQHN